MMITNNQHKDNTGVYIFIAVVAVLIILAFTSCYNQRKATSQFSKSVIAYPSIGANFCAITYPIKDSTIRDTLLTTDTLYLEQLSDTVMVQDFDTVRIYITKTLPAKIITNTIHIRDTIIKENTAKLETCQLERQTTLNLLNDSQKKLSIAEGKANKRGIFMWSFLALIIVYCGWKVYGMFKPKIK